MDQFLPETNGTSKSLKGIGEYGVKGVEVHQTLVSPPLTNLLEVPGETQDPKKENRFFSVSPSHYSDDLRPGGVVGLPRGTVETRET